MNISATRSIGVPFTGAMTAPVTPVSTLPFAAHADVAPVAPLPRAERFGTAFAMTGHPTTWTGFDLAHVNLPIGYAAETPVSTRSTGTHLLLGGLALVAVTAALFAHTATAGMTTAAVAFLSGPRGGIYLRSMAFTADAYLAARRQGETNADSLYSGATQGELVCFAALLHNPRFTSDELAQFLTTEGKADQGRLSGLVNGLRIAAQRDPSFAPAIALALSKLGATYFSESWEESHRKIPFQTTHPYFELVMPSLVAMAEESAMAAWALRSLLSCAHVNTGKGFESTIQQYVPQLAAIVRSTGLVDDIPATLQPTEESPLTTADMQGGLREILLQEAETYPTLRDSIAAALGETPLPPSESAQKAQTYEAGQTEKLALRRSRQTRIAELFSAGDDASIALAATEFLGFLAPLATSSGHDSRLSDDDIIEDGIAGLLHAAGDSPVDPSWSSATALYVTARGPKGIALQNRLIRELERHAIENPQLLWSTALILAFIAISDPKGNTEAQAAAQRLRPYAETLLMNPDPTPAQAALANFDNMRKGKKMQHTIWTHPFGGFSTSEGVRTFLAASPSGSDTTPTASASSTSASPSANTGWRAHWARRPWWLGGSGGHRTEVAAVTP